MSQANESGPRVLIGLHEEGIADWPHLGPRLIALGATQAGPPGAAVAGVAMVQLPQAADVAAFVSAAQALPGVRYAEAEAFSFGFKPDGGFT
jgi:hypothetical protein